MLILPHAVIGATIATLVKDPLLSAPLSLSSHFLADMMPHWNPHINAEIKKYHRLSEATLTFIAIDCLLAICVVSVIAFQKPIFSLPWFNILLCSLLAILPDLLEIPHFFSRRRYRLIENLVSFQSRHQWNVSPLLGLLIQSGVVVICLAITNSVLYS